MDDQTIRYEREGPVATITLSRPEAANAQSSRMITELDAAFDRAEADDEIRVIVLGADGKHFSAGHDLKEILAGEEEWAAKRATPEGKLEHERIMYWDKLLRIRDCPKITIAAVQGVCSAAGLMLAAMCDLIVAGDDARFSNPVARMSGVGVELLIEPWELGPRRAKEFLLCATTLDAFDAQRMGLVNRVVDRDDLADRGARDGRGGRPRPTRHGPSHQGHDQPHRRRHGPAGVLAVSLHGPPVRQQLGGGSRSYRGPQERRHGRGEGRTGRRVGVDRE